MGSGSVAGGSVAGGSVAGGSVAGGSVAGGSVTGGSVAGGSVTWGVVFCGVELSGVEESAGLPLQPARASISSEATRQRAIKTLFFIEASCPFSFDGDSICFQFITFLPKMQLQSGYRCITNF